MHLQSISISGFRTFAQLTKLKFHRGCNVIIGPNLCGKSNFIDALSWSLGISNESFSPENILFRGVNSRAPMLAAFVRLSLLETEEQPSNLTISRHLYFSRNQEGYRINDSDSLSASIPEPQAELVKRIHLILNSSDLILAAEKEPRGEIFIFDEIDDDLLAAGYEKIIQALSRLRVNNQIIMVTHNKLLMTEADQLIGITMEEYGVSEFVNMQIR